MIIRPNRSFLLFAALLVFSVNVFAQSFTRADSLRGSITPERAWWDLTYYHLDIEVLPDEKKIVGSNTIRYQVLEPNQVLQVDLQRPLAISKIWQGGVELDFSRDGNAYFVSLKEDQRVGEIKEIKVFLSITLTHQDQEIARICRLG